MTTIYKYLGVLFLFLFVCCCFVFVFFVKIHFWILFIFCCICICENRFWKLFSITQIFETIRHSKIEFKSINLMFLLDLEHFVNDNSVSKQTFVLSKYIICNFLCAKNMHTNVPCYYKVLVLSKCTI